MGRTVNGVSRRTTDIPVLLRREVVGRESSRSSPVRMRNAAPVCPARSATTRSSQATANRVSGRTAAGLGRRTWRAGLQPRGGEAIGGARERSDRDSVRRFTRAFVRRRGWRASRHEERSDAQGQHVHGDDQPKNQDHLAARGGVLRKTNSRPKLCVLCCEPIDLFKRRFKFAAEGRGIHCCES